MIRVRVITTCIVGGAFLIGACGGELAPEPDAAIASDANIDVTDSSDANDGAPDAGADVVDSAIVVVATNQPGPFAITVDKESVYWTNIYAGPTTSAGWLMKCSIAGCNDTPLMLSTGNETQYAIAVAGNTVYSAGSSLAMCSTSGCGVGVNFVPSAGGLGVAVDGTNVYWTSAVGVMSCSAPSCGAPATFAQGAAFGIASDGVYVYWTEPIAGGAVNKAPKGGGGATIVAPGQDDPVAIAVDAVNVYWTNVGDQANGAVMECAKTGCSTPTLLASGQYQPFAIVSDGTNVYWASTGVYKVPTEGTIMRCAVGGCGGKPTALATGQGYPNGIAVDETSVYWTNMLDGTVVKLTPK